MPRHRLAAVAGTLALVALTSASGGPALAATANVNVADNTFQPTPVTIQAGDTVVWTATGVRPHTVTADDGSFDSGTMSTGGTFSRTFEGAGTFRYFCRFHGAAGGTGMAGVIVVEAAQATTTTTAATTTTTAAVTTTTAAPTSTTTPATTAPPSVLGTTAGQSGDSAPLPRTGLPAAALAAIGAALVLGGAAAVRRTGRTGRTRRPG